MSRSEIYTANTSPNVLTVSTSVPFATIPLGSTIRRFGCNLNQLGNGITASGAGYYKVSANITAQPSAVGTVTASLFRDGVAVPGATASASVSTAGNSVTLPIDALIRNQCCDSSATLTIALSGTTATVTNIAVVVDKL